MTKYFILLCLFIPLNYNVEGAMKKSWKPAVNFDEDAPKFTPFDEEDAGGRPPAEHHHHVHHDHHHKPKYEALLDPSPSPETFADESPVKSPFRSKVKASHFKRPVHKKDHKYSDDFGTFHDDFQADDPEVDEKYQEPIQHDQQQEPENIEEMLDDFIEANIESAEDEKQSDDGAATVEDEEEESPKLEEKPSKPKTSHYKVGPLMNLTVNEKDNLVNVKIDENAFKEIITGKRKGKFELLLGRAIIVLWIGRESFKTVIKNSKLLLKVKISF